MIFFYTFNRLNKCVFFLSKKKKYESNFKILENILLPIKIISKHRTYFMKKYIFTHLIWIIYFSRNILLQENGVPKSKKMLHSARF